MGTSCHFPIELNNIIRYKEDLMTDAKNVLDHCTDDLELLAKKLEDVDVQLIECLQQIKNMAEEKETRENELEELRSVAQVVVDMVDPREERVVSDKTLLE
jgi:peroxiredoxin family protein